MSFLRLSASVLLVAGGALGQYIPQAAFSRTYNDSRGYPRGWIGQAPVNFVVTGVKVFNEGKHTLQTVSIMALATKPPSFPSSYTVKATDLKFFKKDVKADTLISTGPILIKKGQWFAVLGVCHEPAQTVSSSYSVTGAFTTNVLGQKMPIQRLIMQAVIRTNNGLGGVALNGTFNMGRVEVHVAGQGPIPVATDYGQGSTTKPIGAKPYMPIPAYSRTYADSRGYPRGFYFQAPRPFFVSGFQVPNESKHTMQTVAFYLLSAKPPEFPAQVIPKATELKFFAKDQKADTLLKPKQIIPVPKGAWVCVLGVNHEAARTLYSSYSVTGAASTKSSVLGQAVQIGRLISQNAIRVNNGLGGIAGNGTTGNKGRVQVHILGQGAFGTIFPEQTTIGSPGIGQTPQLDIKGNIPGAQLGLLLLSNKRLAKLTTPFGDLLVSLPLLAVLPVPTGTAKMGVPIPNDKGLFNVLIDWQTFVFNGTTQTFGSTNGTEWKLGQ